jgi:TorA maturation chaperone TorD
MEVFRALGVLAEPPSQESEVVSRALDLEGSPSSVEYTELFQLNLYPYASVHLGDEGMLGGEARDRVAGFWRALGVVPPPEPDHLAALLALYATLTEAGVPEDMRRALLWEHLLPWLPAWLDKAKEIAPRFYRAWAELLEAALLLEAERRPAERLVPLHLREASALADPRTEGLEPFVTSLLASARSGMVLVRADLVRAARELGLGLRLGERRFILHALLGQDARESLRWLAEEAESWSDRHRRLPGAFAPVTDVWAARADRTAALLAELAETAATTEREVVGV